MMSYRIVEVDGTDPDTAALLHGFNAMAPETFPPLEPHHIETGFWWIAYLGSLPVAFAGMVEFLPFRGVAYLKRCYVLPDHRGHGLQLRFMFTREVKALTLGWHLLASETAAGNVSSASSFARAGFEKAHPEQPWGRDGDTYWVKRLES